MTATAELFRAGLADPRDRAYRVIEVGTGSCWSGDAGLVTTHGWVLPALDAKKSRFAVPLVVTVELLNRGGLDQSIPTQWYRKDGPTLRSGVRVQLWHTTGELEKSTQKPRWTEISIREIGRLNPDEKARTLAPTESFTAFEIDLRGTNKMWRHVFNVPNAPAR